MAWRIEFDPAAEKEFGKLGSTVQGEIISYLEKLSALKDPRSRGKALRGDKAGLWRYRIGKYRLICKIEEHRFIVFVIRVGKRDKIYE